MNKDRNGDKDKEIIVSSIKELRKTSKNVPKIKFDDPKQKRAMNIIGKFIFGGFLGDVKKRKAKMDRNIIAKKNEDGTYIIHISKLKKDMSAGTEYGDYYIEKIVSVLKSGTIVCIGTMKEKEREKE